MLLALGNSEEDKASDFFEKSQAKRHTDEDDTAHDVTIGVLHLTLCLRDVNDSELIRAVQLVCAVKFRNVFVCHGFDIEHFEQKNYAKHRSCDS